ncbi:MAG: hypothetical protein ABI411_15485 [Tahibacter sp.]
MSLRFVLCEKRSGDAIAVSASKLRCCRLRRFAQFESELGLLQVCIRRWRACRLILDKTVYCNRQEERSGCQRKEDHAHNSGDVHVHQERKSTENHKRRWQECERNPDFVTQSKLIEIRHATRPFESTHC